MMLKLSTLRALRRAAGSVVSSIRPSSVAASAPGAAGCQPFTLQALEDRLMLHHVTPPADMPGLENYGHEQDEGVTDGSNSGGVDAGFDAGGTESSLDGGGFGGELVDAGGASATFLGTDLHSSGNW